MWKLYLRFSLFYPPRPEYFLLCYYWLVFTHEAKVEHMNIMLALVFQLILSEKGYLFSNKNTPTGAEYI